jgi:hypothetical protein
MPEGTEILSSNYNAVLFDGCSDLSGVTVRLEVTEDLVTLGNTGFSLQLNAFPQSGVQCQGQTLNWLQYVIYVANGSLSYEIQYWAVGAPGNWPAGYTPQPNTTPWLPVFPNDYYLTGFGSISSNQLPKGSALEIELTTDGSHRVSNATFSYIDPSGNVSPGSFAFPEGTLYPIVAFELNLVGPGGLSKASFTSGAGLLTYSVTSGSLSVQPGGLGGACGEAAIPTGETSNAFYDPVSPMSGPRVTQSLGIASMVVACQILDSGDVFFLVNDGALMYVAGGLTANPPLPPAPLQVDLDAMAFQALDSDHVFVLGSDGNLWLEQGPWTSMTRQHIDGNVAGFQALDANEVYVLGSDGNLWDEQGPWNAMTRQKVDGSVKAFQAVDGRAYVLGTDGNLWDETGPWNQMTRLHVDGNVAQFQALVEFGGPQAFVLGTDGNLWLETGPWTNMTREHVDGTVRGFQALNTSECYVLGRDGNLWYEQGSWNAMTRKQVDGNVAEFEAFNTVQACVVGRDGTLWSESGPWGTVPPTRHQIGGGIYP